MIPSFAPDFKLNGRKRKHKPLYGITRPSRPIRCDMWIVERMRYPTDRPTNRQTDTAGCRGALSHLKTITWHNFSLESHTFGPNFVHPIWLLIQLTHLGLSDQHLPCDKSYVSYHCSVPTINFKGNRGYLKKKKHIHEFRTRT